jgi:hypothetical protein
MAKPPSASPSVPAGPAAARPVWRRLLAALGGRRRSGPSAAQAGAHAADGAPGPGASVQAGAAVNLKRRAPATVGIPLGVARVPASEAIPGTGAAPAGEPVLLTEALPTRQPAAGAPSRGVVKHSPGRFIRGDEKLLEGVRAAMVEEGAPRAIWALYLLCLFVIAALVWAFYARVDIVTRAEGRIVPEAREQVIASLEAGILRALHVREGAIVQPGEELAQLDPTRVAAQQNEGLAKQTAPELPARGEGGRRRGGRRDRGL